MSLKKQLEAGLNTLQIGYDDRLTSLLLGFLEDLVKWNKVYNLTAIRDPSDMVVQHLLDSLSIAPYVSSETVIDVGTGGGFPGIPLGMLYPEKSVALLDSNVKKTRFLRQIVINHSLKNCEVLHTRAESCSRVFETVVCRAFASLPDIIGFAGHLVAPGGRLLAMKGQLGDEVEQVADAQDFEILRVLPLEVPGLNAQRHLIELGPKQ